MRPFAGFENSVEMVMEDLLASLDHPGLALLQWDEVFSVVQVSVLQCQTYLR